MLDDRPYMRPDYRPDGSYRSGMPLTILMMIVLVVAFALQQINDVYLRFPIYEYLALSPAGLRHGYVWQLLTFQFLHAGLLHLLFNLLGLWWFGKFVEERMGRAHFLKIYFLSGVVGGLLQSVLMWLFPLHFGGVVLGASAGIYGLLVAYAMIEPDATIMFEFVLPIRARYLFYIAGAIELFFTLVPSDGMAHAAHLGGMLFAFAYMRWGLDFSRTLSEWNPLHRRSRREQMVKAATVTVPRSGSPRRARLEESTDLPSEEFISKQVDPILDKISAHGIQSLTDRERQILQAARAKMSKR